MGKILVTGIAGFIGFHLANKLLQSDFEVVGLDNVNDYYDVGLKEARLQLLRQRGLKAFEKLDLADTAALKAVFKKYTFDRVVHLAAQAGVRYSLENPHVYTQSNLVGFGNLLDCAQHNNIQHLIYASTSSVYGANQKYPFQETDSTDHPVSFYAATKKANEVMAYSYASLYKIPMTGLRFFTVYGPWGRPDMALFKFTQNILRGEPIEVFNHGELYRDFTYVDDIVEGLCQIIPHPPTQPVPHEIYNIGFGHPVKLTDFIDELESQLGIKAKRISAEMQKGDMFKTFADTHKLRRDFAYQPKIPLKEGIHHFLEWYRSYYQI